MGNSHFLELQIWSLNTRCCWVSYLTCLVYIKSCKWCSEIERQNSQTTVSDESTGIRHSKRQQVACCICKQNNWHLYEFSNRPRLDKKQVVKLVNEKNEMGQWSCVNWILFIARKKQEVISKMAYLKVRKWCECVWCVPEV